MESTYPGEHTSAEQVYTQVKHILRSYMAAGAISDDMFEFYTRELIEQTGEGNLVPKETLIELYNRRARLPEFISLDQIWYCASEHCQMVTMPTTQGVEYLDEEDRIIEDPLQLGCADCGGIAEPVDIRMRLVKHAQVYVATFRKSFLLEPGNVSTLGGCVDCGPHSVRANLYTVTGRDITTQLSSGYLYIKYQDMDFDKDGFPIIPAHARFVECLRNKLLYKCFEDLWHNASDESSAQVQNKMSFYKGEYDTTSIQLSSYNKMPQFQKFIRKSRRRKSQFSPYHIQ